MNILFSNILIGSILILYGLSILTQAFFGFSIPIIRPLIAGLFIYAGIRLFMNDSHKAEKTTKNINFSQESVDGNHHYSTYNVSFGRGFIDLSSSSHESKVRHISINIIFGSGTIKINPDIPTRIHVKTFLGSAELPDRTTIALGSYSYKNYHEDKNPQLEITMNVIFGAVKII